MIFESAFGVAPAAVASKRPLIGRGPELAALDALWGVARARGRVNVALLMGPPGIGKSRLVEEFARRASTEGVVALEDLVEEYVGTVRDATHVVAERLR